MRVVRSANRFSQISVNIWAINAKHRHRKGRANTLFVIGRNIDGSMIDLRRFYLIISRPDRESSLIKDPSKVKDSYLLSLKGAHPCTSSLEQGGGKRVLEDFF